MQTVPPSFKPAAGRTTAAMAFTLIEIMLVVAIIMLVLSLSAVALHETLFRPPMTQAIKDIIEACNGTSDHAGARDLAILRGEITMLRIFPKTRHIEVGGAPPPPGPGNEMDAGVEPPRQSKRGGFSAQLSPHLNFRVLDVNFQEFKDEEVAVVRFYPNGTSDELTLVLESDTGEKKEIRLDLFTARADVVNTD